MTPEFINEMRAFRTAVDTELNALYKRWREPSGRQMPGAQENIERGRRDILFRMLPKMKDILAIKDSDSGEGIAEKIPLIDTILRICHMIK